jgi:hypothetical protein
MSNSNNILLLVKKHHEKLIAKYMSRINQLEAENNLFKYNNMEANNKLIAMTSENETLRNEFNVTIDLLTKYFDSYDDKLLPIFEPNKLVYYNIDKLDNSTMLNNEPSNFESKDSKSIMLLNNEPVENQDFSSATLLGESKAFPNNEQSRMLVPMHVVNEPSLTLSDKLDYSTMLNNEPMENQGFSATKLEKLNKLKSKLSPSNKYLQRHHYRRIPLIRRMQKYKASNYKSSSDTDEENSLTKKPFLEVQPCFSATKSNNELKIVSSPVPSPIENTPINVLKKILTDDFSASKNNKDAPYSFNNMKPYIFTLDKNNKK